MSFVRTLKLNGLPEIKLKWLAGENFAEFVLQHTCFSLYGQRRRGLIPLCISVPFSIDVIFDNEEILSREVVAQLEKVKGDMLDKVDETSVLQDIMRRKEDEVRDLKVRIISSFLHVYLLCACT